MCLWNNPEAVQKFLDHNKGKETVRAYKILKVITRLNENSKVKRRTLNSPHRDCAEWTSGEYVSDSKAKANAPVKSQRSIENGIHVYVSLAMAKQNKVWMTIGEKRVIVPVTCRIADLIGVDNGKRAVFRKVHLDQRHIDKALGRKKKSKRVQQAK